MQRPAGFTGFLKAVIGVTVEISATLALMAAVFAAGFLILRFFSK